ncbi:MAG: hypothetical protein EXR58_03535 [Chloroflexi bacterium]|nr:hypothetical protein [Chloroflexota bacterium]
MGSETWDQGPSWRCGRRRDGKAGPTTAQRAGISEFGQGNGPSAEGNEDEDACNQASRVRSPSRSGLATLRFVLNNYLQRLAGKY